MKSNLEVVKSNAIVTASFSMSKMEQIILLGCIAKINSTKIISETDEFEITASEIMDLIDTKNAYKNIKIAVDKLFDRKILVKESVGHNTSLKPGEIIKMRWITYSHYMPQNSVITVRFSSGVIPYLSEIRGNYIKYNLKWIAGMSSKYGPRLFELLQKWNITGIKEFSIGEIREIFQIGEKKYKNSYSFKKNVLEPAILDVNSISNMWVNAKYPSRGKILDIVQLEFGLQKMHEIVLNPPGKKRIGARKNPKDNMSLTLGFTNSEIVKNAKKGETYLKVATRLKERKDKKKANAKVKTKTTQEKNKQESLKYDFDVLKDLIKVAEIKNKDDKK